MNAEDYLQSCAVVGAAGKMGNGIALVLLQAIARLDARKGGVPGSGRFELALIDSNREGLRRLREYLRAQMTKHAEKRIGQLREWARDRADLVENGEIIAAYVEGALGCARFDTDLSAAHDARVVFEAVFEDLDVKQNLYARLKGICGPETCFLTNTSSIPISALGQRAGLGGRMLGYHFYNPPAVQKLVEVISGRETSPVLIELGAELGRVLEKTLVPSQDTAGFIGNGHFIREGLFALEKFRELRGTWPDAEAVFLINKVTQDFLVRPMGMFQLIDYVGIDVFQMILNVMGKFIPGESFRSELISDLLAAGVRGGQMGSGEQKDGFCKYERNRITAVYDLKEGRYVSLDEREGFHKALAWLGPLPEPHAAWSRLSKSPDRKEKLAAYFAALAKADNPGARLAREFLANSRRIAEGLVASQVAKDADDVSAVLVNGFCHLYGPFEFQAGA